MSVCELKTTGMLIIHRVAKSKFMMKHDKHPGQKSWEKVGFLKLLFCWIISIKECEN